jgi:type III pantothenate kinase
MLAPAKLLRRIRFVTPPRLTVAEFMPATPSTLIAVDIGNSRMKLGRFSGGAPATGTLAKPEATLELPISHATGEFDREQLRSWCDEQLRSESEWLVGTVHRKAGERLAAAVEEWSTRSGIDCEFRKLTYRDVPLEIRTDQPERVGLDRLLAALAADRVRRPDRAAMTIDMGTAITVDLVEADGAFAGGAILPGIATSAKALADHTDALPNIGLAHLAHPPAALGKSTGAAIEAGLYWGAVGAVRELVAQMSKGLESAPELFLTGGASSHVADLLAAQHAAPVHYVPHLVLSGIALVQR